MKGYLIFCWTLMTLLYSYIAYKDVKRFGSIRDSTVGEYGFYVIIIMIVKVLTI